MRPESPLIDDILDDVGQAVNPSALDKLTDENVAPSKATASLLQFVLIFFYANYS